MLAVSATTTLFGPTAKYCASAHELHEVLFHSGSEMFRWCHLHRFFTDPEVKFDSPSVNSMRKMHGLVRKEIVPVQNDMYVS